MTRMARAMFLIALSVVIVVLVIAYVILRSSEQGSSTSDENAYRWGYISTFDAGWSSPESPTERPEVSTVDTGEEHFEIDEGTPTSQTPTLARPTTDVVCRTGPSTLYPPQTFLSTDQSLPLDGRNEGSSWWRLQLSDDTSCWVWAELLDITGDTDGVPELQPPPLPTATDRPETAPGTTAGCWVIDQQHPNGYCRPGSCTPNDFPGTACTIP